jgi:uncharacterized protein (DUF2164 family)
MLENLIEKIDGAIIPNEVMDDHDEYCWNQGLTRAIKIIKEELNIKLIL